MKPLIFDYTQLQTKKDFPNLVYDTKLNLNLLDGKIFVENDAEIISYITKTNAQRETDDEDINNKTNNYLSLQYLTKTKAQHESDDENIILGKNNDSLLYFLCKTEAERELDDEE